MLTAVVTFLLLIIALLAVPVTLTFQMSWQQAFQSDIRILWLFGLVRIRLHSFGPESPLPEGKERAQQSGHPGRTTHNRQHIYAAIREKSFRRRFIRYICDLWRYLHKRDVRMQIRIGLGDPADTGQLWAVAGPVAGILSNAREASIEIVPEFIDETFELDSSGNIRLVPLQMLYLTAGLLLSPSVWQGIKQMRIAD